MTQSVVDRSDFEKFIKLLCIKSTQIIVQGRIGKLISTSCTPHAGTEWKMFNLAIKDYPDIDREANAAISNGLPGSNNSYVIEISLRTSDADALVLEVWSIAFINKRESLDIRREVYNRITLLLKSLLCVSRVTPAYKLSRRQGGDFVVCYRVYMGSVNLTGLGEGFKTLRVGAVATPYGTFSLSVAYRPTENLHVSTQQISPEATMPFELHDDHFAMSKPFNTSSAKPCRTLHSRLRTLSENSDGQSFPSIETSPSYNTFNASYSQSPLKIGRVHCYKGQATSFVRMKNERVLLSELLQGTPPRDLPISVPPGIVTAPNNSNPDMFFMLSGDLEQHGRRDSSSNFFGSYVVTVQKITRANRRESFPSSYGRRTPPHVTQQRRNTSPVTAVSGSAPTRAARHREVVTSPDSLDGRFVAASPTDRKPPIARGKTNETTYRHWNNSNVTMVTADRKSKRAELSSSISTIDDTEWTRRSTKKESTTIDSSFAPIHEVGAFVLACGYKSPPTTSPVVEASSLPFSDLMSAIEDDNGSEHSSSSGSDTTGGSFKHHEKSSDRRSSSSSSKVSWESPGPVKQAADEYVLVDLNPAFARGNSAEDVGTFYKMCKNPPELSLFEEGGGIETAETILELSKQLDDFKQNMDDFDFFIRQISS